MNLEEMQAIPHFATKVPIKQRLLEFGPHVVLSPNFFFQNDLLGLEAILKGGVYPLPVGETGIWSIHTDDIGRAAFNALTSDRWDGQSVPLCGPEKLTGPRLAADWQEALGQPVRYLGDAIDPFIAAMAAHFPMDDWLTQDMRRMMEVTQSHGCPASDADRAAAAEIIGQPPMSHRQFCTSVAAGLTGPGAA